MAVSSGWGSLLDFGSLRSSALIGCPKACELTGGRSSCLCHWGKFFGHDVLENESDCRISPPESPFGPQDADEPKDSPANRYQIGHHQGTGMTDRSTNSHGTNLSVGSGVFCGEIVWIPTIPTCDWLMGRVLLTWPAPPILELLKVPIAEETVLTFG